MSSLNSHGQEIFDQTPVEFPIHFDRPTPLHIRLREQILRAMSDMRESSEYDTPEEADDFYMDDEPDMWDSPYEGDFDHITKENKSSAASKEEHAEGGSSDGATQGEQSEPSSKKE